MRPGVYKCATCRQQFTVTVGTIFESSKVGLHKWPHAIHLMCASKKGMSAHQLHRDVGVQYKTAWFICHRIRNGGGEGWWRLTRRRPAGSRKGGDEDDRLNARLAGR